MAQYYTDFSGYTDGNQPSDWTQTDASGNGWEVVSDASHVGGKALELIATAGGVTVLTWDEVGTPSEVEVVFLGGPAAAQDAIMCTVCHSDLNNYYALGTDNGAGELDIIKVTDGTESSITNENRSPAGDFWVRAYFNDSTNELKVRLWEDGTSEPSSWDLETTDSDHSSGSVGVLVDVIVADDVFYQQFGVGTEGDTAPTSEPANPPAAPTSLQLSEQ